jgi:hypothetical protein
MERFLYLGLAYLFGLCLIVVSLLLVALCLVVIKYTCLVLCGEMPADFGSGNYEIML